MPDSWFSRVHDLTLRLVAWPSVTGTAGEGAFAQHLQAWLAQQPYFAAHPADLRLAPLADDATGRANLFALVRGRGAATVILAGHYDVVSVAAYGALAPWACEPAALLPRLVADLQQRRLGAADGLALRDLMSGEYLPGRGVLDMKSGLAAGLAVLLEFAAAPAPPNGNLLFLTTPDEEANSAGMRAAALALPALLGEWGLEPVAAINLDAAGDRGDGAAGRAVFLGSVGKLLPSVYVVGRETHAGYPFDGINPNLLAAEITRRIDGNVALCDAADGELAPPPVSLAQIDLKPHYDVTTPAAAWCTFNFLTHRRSAAAVLDLVQAISAAALAAACHYWQEQATAWAAASATEPSPPAGEPLVLSFAELQERALQHGGAGAAETLAATIARLQADPAVDLPAFCRGVTAALWSLSGLTGPAAVVGLASLSYPHVRLSDTAAGHARLHAVAGRQAAALAAETGASIRRRSFFPGISDMSFLAPSAQTAAELASIAANTPAWGSRIAFDYGVLQALNLPVINVGPWGRDYHQRTERVNMPYSFGVVPELIWRIVADLLG